MYTNLLAFVRNRFHRAYNSKLQQTTGSVDEMCSNKIYFVGIAAATMIFTPIAAIGGITINAGPSSVTVSISGDTPVAWSSGGLYPGTGYIFLCNDSLCNGIDSPSDVRWSQSIGHNSGGWGQQSLYYRDFSGPSSFELSYSQIGGQDDLEICTDYLSDDSGIFYHNGMCSSRGQIPPTPPGPSCSINNNSDINVSFGQIDRLEVGTTVGGQHTQSKSFTVSCTGNSTVNFNVSMNASPASWNGDAIQSSNSNIGVITTWNGNKFSNGASEHMTVNGSSAVNLTFTPVHPSNIGNDKISVGGFSASATLIVTQV